MGKGTVCVQKSTSEIGMHFPVWIIALAPQRLPCSPRHLVCFSGEAPRVQDGRSDSRLVIHRRYLATTSRKVPLGTTDQATFHEDANSVVPKGLSANLPCTVTRQ